MTDPFVPHLPPDSDAFRAALLSQDEAADPAHSAWVAANAGSGKTKVLIDRVARLLLNGAAPDSILCITYTRAAANEMVTRLFERLGEWSVMDGDALASKLAALQGRQPESYEEEALRHARALFARALETPGGLRIETIHAFCARILRRFPLEAGLAPGFREVEEAELDLFWRDAVAAGIERAAREDGAGLDRLAREGGASGAMTGLGLARKDAAALLAFAARHDHDPDAMAGAIRASIGAPDASREQRLAEAMGRAMPVDDLRRAREALLSCGKSDSARTAGHIETALAGDSPEDRWQACRGIVFTKDGKLRNRTYNKDAAKDPLVVDLFSPHPPQGREVTRLMELDTALKAAEAAERTAALLAIAIPVLSRFQAAKSAHAALDFDDLITRTRALIAGPGASDWVRFKLDGGLTHVLLDEAQDTSPPQWELIEALTEEFFAGAGAVRGQDPRTLFVVGDEKQSIYSFQGADPDGFLDRRQAFTAKAPDGVTPDMTMSFRSAPQVLDFVDAVFNADDFAGAAFSRHVPGEADDIHHPARRANQPGRVELFPIEAAEQEDPADPWDIPLDTMRESSPKARLARRIAARLRAMIDAGETVWAEGADRSWQRRAMRAEDVLILVRGRKGGLFDALIKALKGEGLPVAGADRLWLSQHIGVQDCLNLMRFAVMPEDDLTLAEILRGPFCGLLDDDTHLFALAHGRKGASLWSRLCDSGDPDHGPSRNFLERCRAVRAAPPFEFLTRCLDDLVTGDETGWDRLLARLGSPAIDPVEALLAQAVAHDSDRPATLEGFLAALEREDVEIKRDLAGADGAVRVMTVHGAKGLQAPVVILPDTTAGPGRMRDTILDLDGAPVWAPRKDGDTDRLAAARERKTEDALREHRRLLYVALTRAQDRLVIAGAWHGGLKTQGRHEQSWYRLCETGMDALSPAPEDRYGNGDDDGVRAFGPPPPRLAETTGHCHTAAPWRPYWLDQPAPGPGHVRRALNPSRLLAGRDPVVSPLGPGALDRRARGRTIHELIERLVHVPEAERDAAAARFLNNLTELEPQARTNIAQTALATLRDPAMAEVFAEDGRSEAAIIGQGTGWPEGTVINGRVDRLVVRASHVLVADIKTDRPPPADASRVSETYLAQMAAYRNVLEGAYPGRPIHCAIVWTDGPQLMSLDDTALLAALKRAQRVV